MLVNEHVHEKGLYFLECRVYIFLKCSTVLVPMGYHMKELDVQIA